MGCDEVRATAVPTPTPAPTNTPLPTATTAPTPTLPPTPTIMEREMRFLALGDSYTIGESVAEAERWPVQLAARLQEQGVRIAAPEIIAKTGWTTDELADRKSVV